MTITMIRSISLLALASAALTAHATYAYNNLDPAPNVYSSASNYPVAWYGGGSFVSEGFQFTAAASGIISGIQVAMNNNGSAGHADYNLLLYADNGSNAFGSLIWTFTGKSTGVFFADASSDLSNVSITGSAVSLTSGTKYWLVATSNNMLAWNNANSAQTNYHQYYTQGPTNDGYGIAGAFAVQVGSTPPVPGPLAALPFALGLLKRRRK